MKIAYTLVGLNEEDVFYFKNMERVHDLALEYRKIVYFYNNRKFMYKKSLIFNETLLYYENNYRYEYVIGIKI